MPTLTGANFVGARESREGAGNSFRAQDQTSGAALDPEFAEATTAEVEAATRGAGDSFESVAAVSPERRATFLRAIADQLEDLGDALLERGESETGLPRPRLTGERARTANQTRLFANLVEEGSWDARIDRVLPDRKPLPRPDEVQLYRDRDRRAEGGLSVRALHEGPAGPDHLPRQRPESRCDRQLQADAAKLNERANELMKSIDDTIYTPTRTPALCGLSRVASGPRASGAPTFGGGHHHGFRLARVRRLSHRG